MEMEEKKGGIELRTLVGSPPDTFRVSRLGKGDERVREREGEENLWHMNGWASIRFMRGEGGGERNGEEDTFGVGVDGFFLIRLASLELSSSKSSKIDELEMEGSVLGGCGTSFGICLSITKG